MYLYFIDISDQFSQKEPVVQTETVQTSSQPVEQAQTAPTPTENPPTQEVAASTETASAPTETTPSIPYGEHVRKVKMVLNGAKNRLVFKGWAKKAYARDKYRHEVQPRSNKAVRFDAIGALIATRKGADNIAVAEAILSRVVRDATGQYFLDNFNDNAKSVDEVVTMFDRAIEWVNQNPSEIQKYFS